jgi:GNAT superfamily N-acetyltransferase
MPNATPVRVADAGDLDALVALALKAREEGGIATPPDSRGRLARQMRAVIADPALTHLVAVQDSEIVGYALLRPLEPSVLYDLPRLQVEGFYVAADRRRRGYGRALIRGALESAERIGAPDITVLSVAGSRSVQRFLARLGFVAAASQRVIDTQSLGASLAEPGAPRRRSVEQMIIARRKRLRDESREPSRAAAPPL